jgi:hypothetical protein
MVEKQGKRGLGTVGSRTYRVKRDSPLQIIGNNWRKENM